MSYETCNYPGCKTESVYDLLWESQDQDGNLIEPEAENFRYSCKKLMHLVHIVKNHPFGPPVDTISIDLNNIHSLPELTKIVNELAKKI